MQLQDIPSYISGDDSCNSDDEQETVEHIVSNLIAAAAVTVKKR